MVTIQAPGHVASGEMYTLQEVKARLGLGTAAMRQARRHGLKVHRIGRNGYVLGANLIAYVEREGNVDA